MKNVLLMLTICCFFVGCGKTEVGLVPGKGVVKDANGRPMAGIMVNFMPDARTGASGPSSTAVSDEQGNFILKTTDGKREGVVSGKHRVTLFDTLEERTAQGEEPSEPTSRIPSKYQTEDGAVQLEVVEGQEITVQIK